MILELTDFQAPELDIYARLTEGQLLNRAEPDKGIFIAESPRVIQTALEMGCTPLSCLVEKRLMEGKAAEVLGMLMDKEKYGELPIYAAEPEVFGQLKGFGMTRGMLCAMRRGPLPLVAEICRGARRIAILEDVMNPTNLGAIFRSAAALGIDGILLTMGCSDPLYRRAIRVSMGTVFQIPWTYMDDRMNEDSGRISRRQHRLASRAIWPEQAADWLHGAGFKLAAMALTEDSVSISDSRLLEEEKLAIVMGTEGDGLAAGTLAACDYTVRIPMHHGVDSLNVAAASAVAFWQLTKA